MRVLLLSTLFTLFAMNIVLAVNSGTDKPHPEKVKKWVNIEDFLQKKPETKRQEPEPTKTPTTKREKNPEPTMVSDGIVKVSVVYH